MVRRFVPAKTECGVGYLKAVGRPTAAQEDELFRRMSGVVGFTSADVVLNVTRKREIRLRKVARVILIRV